MVQRESDLDDVVDAWHAGDWSDSSLEDVIRERTGWTHAQYADWVLCGEVAPNVTVVEHAERGNAKVIIAPARPLRLGDLCRVDGELHRVVGAVALQDESPRYLVNGQQCLLLRPMP